MGPFATVASVLSGAMAAGTWAMSDSDALTGAAPGVGIAGNFPPGSAAGPGAAAPPGVDFGDGAGAAAIGPAAPMAETRAAVSGVRGLWMRSGAANASAPSRNALAGSLVGWPKAGMPGSGGERVIELGLADSAPEGNGTACVMNAVIEVTEVPARAVAVGGDADVSPRFSASRAGEAESGGAKLKAGESGRSLGPTDEAMTAASEGSAASLGGGDRVMGGTANAVAGSDASDGMGPVRIAEAGRGGIAAGFGALALGIAANAGMSNLSGRTRPRARGGSDIFVPMAVGVLVCTSPGWTAPAAGPGTSSARKPASDPGGGVVCANPMPCGTEIERRGLAPAAICSNVQSSSRMRRRITQRAYQFFTTGSDNRGNRGVFPMSDLAVLPQATPQVTPERREQLREVARDLEASFLAEMLRYAGSAATRTSFGGGAGEEQFSSFLRTEQARAMAQGGGIGLAESLFNALVARDGGGP